jgi:glyoxylase-like metal-dependent hydrolase (beta-lactamase superfamily II)
VKSGEITVEMLAGLLYDSLRNKIMKYSDEVVIYPGHGAGSSCGKSIGAGKSCTIGK